MTAGCKYKTNLSKRREVELPGVVGSELLIMTDKSRSSLCAVEKCSKLLLEMEVLPPRW